MLAKRILLTVALMAGAAAGLQADLEALIVPILFQGGTLAQMMSAQGTAELSDADTARIGYTLVAPTLIGLAHDASYAPGDTIPSTYAGEPVQIETRATGDRIEYLIRDEPHGLKVEMSYDTSTRTMEYHEERISSLPTALTGSDAPQAELTVIDMKDATVQLDLSFHCRISVLIYDRLSDGFCTISGVDNADFISTPGIHGMAYSGFASYFGPDIIPSTDTLTDENTKQIADQGAAKLESESGRQDEWNALWFENGMFDYAGSLRGGQSLDEMIAAMPWRPDIQ